MLKKKSMDNTKPKNCQCGAAIEERVYDTKSGIKKYFPKYCSRQCAYSLRVRPTGLDYKIVAKNKSWFKNKGGCVDEHGYNKIHIGKGKYKREHRVVMQKYLGRELSIDEVVHHINGDKLDNRIENLQVMSKKEHDKLHNGKKICLI